MYVSTPTRPLHAPGLVTAHCSPQAIDNIPPAIRRANPNITREYYLRMRAQVR